MRLGQKRLFVVEPRWWDNEIKEKISLRRELYKKVISGREELRDEYCRLRKEVKELVREKKLNI